MYRDSGRVVVEVGLKRASQERGGSTEKGGRESSRGWIGGQ
jgi:hypothetical protein